MNIEVPWLYDTDSYKASHFLQMPKGAKRSFYYIEARGGDTSHVSFFGIQYFIKEYMMKVPTKDQVILAAEIWEAHGLPFNKEGWLRIAEMGYMPIEIKAVPEGMKVPTGRVLVTFETTEDGFEWLAGWVETIGLQVWYPTTVATNSYNSKRAIYKALVKSGDNHEMNLNLNFKLHDFGFRGVSSRESAMIGGMAHLSNFWGTDTMIAVVGLIKYYNAKGVKAYSIPAAEHSTVTSHISEVVAFDNFCDKFAGNKYALMAFVSDSYNLDEFVRNVICGSHKQRIIESGTTLVVRPDSGIPKEVVVRVAKILDEGYGSTINNKGYKVLHPSVRIIQGDGISGASDISEILDALMDAGFSADNIAFGQGGGLLQQCDRDTYKFVMKCSAILCEDGWRDVFKCPIDAPWKASKKGRLTLTKDFVNILVDECKPEWELLRVVFRDGKILVDEDIDTIRERAWSNFDKALYDTKSEVVAA